MSILPIEPKSAALAREWISIMFDAWNLPATETAELAVTELVANVWNHARIGDSLCVQIIEGIQHVRVEVHDESTRRPVLDTSTEMSESGNGLFLVDALVGGGHWGFRRTLNGKCVWFDVALYH